MDFSVFNSNMTKIGIGCIFKTPACTIDRNGAKGVFILIRFIEFY